MSHQYQQPQGAMQQSGGTQQSGGMQRPGGMQQPGGTQQSGGMQHGAGGEMGLRLSEVETPEQRMAVEDIGRAIQVCGWCADQCIQLADPTMVECIQYCEDVTELGEVALALLPRGSPYTASVLQTFAEAARACAAECGQHHHAHCQECAEVLGTTVETVDQLLATLGGGAQGGGTGQPVPAAGQPIQGGQQQTW